MIRQNNQHFYMMMMPQIQKKVKAFIQTYLCTVHDLRAKSNLYDVVINFVYKFNESQINESTKVQSLGAIVNKQTTDESVLT